MPKAFWNGAMLAQSNLCRIVCGKYCFPSESIRFEFFKASSTSDYFDIEVDGEVNRAAARQLFEPADDAGNFAQFITFGEKVNVID